MVDKEGRNRRGLEKGISAKSPPLRYSLTMDLHLPMEVDPEIMSGTPVFRGTRVPVQSLFEHLESDYSIDGFIELFPTVRREDVIDLLEKTKNNLLESVLR